jgi:FixJ family two-component response regulator
MHARLLQSTYDCGIITMGEGGVTCRRECIAILDDDASVRKALARLISVCSYTVQTYGSAREFIDSLNTSVPDCLILDLQMEDVTGLELLNYLNCRGTPIPTVVLTAQDEPGTHERCADAGAVAFLIKPIGKEQLLKSIEAATRRHAPLSAAARI